ncbi:Ribokinase [subsurface metagenome]
MKAIELARGANKLISFDPNLRPSLWENLRLAKSEIENGLQYADIIKLTDEELEFITGTKNLIKGTNIIMKYGPRVVFVTRGGKSAFINNGMTEIEVPSYELKSIDTTGAGDQYAAGFLHGYANKLDLNKCGTLGALLAGTVIENYGARIPGKLWEKVLEEADKIAQEE